MSIIYEALKKTQTSPDGINRQSPAGVKDPANPKPSLFKKQAGLSIAGVALGIIFTWLITNRLSSPLSPPRNNKPQQKARHTAGPSGVLPQLLLNGIVLSEDGSIAMINDQICKAGDEIEGAKIVEITPSRVTLSFKNQEIVLKNK